MEIPAGLKPDLSNGFLRSLPSVLTCRATLASLGCESLNCSYKFILKGQAVAKQTKNLNTCPL